MNQQKCRSRDKEKRMFRNDCVCLPCKSQISQALDRAIFGGKRRVKMMNFAKDECEIISIVFESICWEFHVGILPRIALAIWRSLIIDRPIVWPFTNEEQSGGRGLRRNILLSICHSCCLVFDHSAHDFPSSSHNCVALNLKYSISTSPNRWWFPSVYSVGFKSNWKRIDSDAFCKLGLWSNIIPKAQTFDTFIVLIEMSFFVISVITSRLPIETNRALCHFQFLWLNGDISWDRPLEVEEDASEGGCPQTFAAPTPVQIVANQRNLKRLLWPGISRNPTQRNSLRSRLRYLDGIWGILPSIAPFHGSDCALSAASHGAGLVPSSWIEKEETQEFRRKYGEIWAFWFYW
jgi:hypothetical protein